MRETKQRLGKGNEMGAKRLADTHEEETEKAKRKACTSNPVLTIDIDNAINKKHLSAFVSL